MMRFLVILRDEGSARRSGTQQGETRRKRLNFTFFPPSDFLLVHLSTRSQIKASGKEGRGFLQDPGANLSR